MAVEARINEDDLGFDEDLRTHQGVPFSGVAFLKHPNGNLEREVSYVNGFREGLFREWFANGQLKSEWFAVHGRVEGKMTEWHENGQVKSIAEYEYGAEISYDEWSAEGKQLISRAIEPGSPLYRYVEKMRGRSR